MGVTGLWQLLNSVGHPIKVDGLEGKRLGVDANVWLYKFIRGFRDKDNATNIDSHKLGLFNRISKLLFYKIKPVFVFDGPAPALKRKTLEKRQNVRNKQLEKVQDAAMKVFVNQLKEKYPEANLDEVMIRMPVLTSSNLVAAEKFNDDDYDLFYLPPEERIIDSESDDDQFSDDSEVVEIKPPIDIKPKLEQKPPTVHYLDQQYYKDTNEAIDIHSKEFDSLPAEVRYELLKDIKESRRKIRRSNNLPEDAGSFSNFQMERLRSRRVIQEKIEQCEKEICSMWTGECDGKTVQSYRVQSDATSTMVYLQKNPGSSSSLSQPVPTKPEPQATDNNPDNNPALPVSQSQTTPPKRLTQQPSSVRGIAEKFAKFSSKKQSKKMRSRSRSPSPVLSPNLSPTHSPESSTIISPPREASPVPVVNSAPSLSSSCTTELASKPTLSQPQSPPHSPLSSIELEESQSQHVTSPASSSTKARTPSPVAQVVLSPPTRPSASHTILISSSPEFSPPTSPKPTTSTQSNTILLSSSPSPSPSPESLTVGPQPEKQLDREEIDPVQETRSELENEKQPEETTRIFSSSQQMSRSEMAGTVRQATKVTSKIIEEAKELLRLFGVPYIVAAGEAEAQCALLEELKLTEGTITDDSDIWLFGAKNVYRHFFSDDKYILQYKMTDIEFHLRMTRENLVCFAMLVGSDYTEGIMNIGPVTAIEILSEFPGPGMEPLVKFREWKDKVKSRMPGNKKRETFLKFKLCEGFPSRTVFEGYMRPSADTSTEQFTWGTPDLDELRDYARRHFGWDMKRIDDKLLPVMKRLNERSTQPTIDSFFFKTAANQDPELFRSKRVNQALGKISKKTAIANDEVVCLTESEDEEDNNLRDGEGVEPVKVLSTTRDRDKKVAAKKAPKGNKRPPKEISGAKGGGRCRKRQQR